MWPLILLALAVGYVVGRWRGFRAGRNRAWLTALIATAWMTQAMGVQLTRAENALADQAEVDHAAARNPRSWRDNGAGYQSRTSQDTSIKAVDGVNVLVMDQSGTSAGTSLERVVAGNVHTELVIGFSFRLDGADAACGGGAPRVYLLGGALYGQVLSCPAASSGWVTVTAADLSWWTGSTNHASWAAAVVAHQGTPLGQVGLVFDNAAGKDAKALFKDLTLAGKRVKFGVPPKPTPSATPTVTVSPTPTATPSETVEPTPTATESSSPSPSGTPSESESAAPVPTVSTSPASGGGGGLPLTGPAVLGIGGAALLLIVVGGFLRVLARRRRDEPEFTA